MNKSLLKISTTLVAVLAVAGAIRYGNKNSNDIQVVDSTPTPSSTPPNQTPVATMVPDPIKTAQALACKDGVYSATGVYVSPGGGQQLGVTLTIVNDIVSNVSVTEMASDGDSREWQGKFISGYKPAVIGKSIATLNVGRTSGSSLTPIGFNDAVAKIKLQAKL